MKTLQWKSLCFLALSFVLMACEQPFIGQPLPEEQPAGPNVVLRVVSFEQIPFEYATTKAAVDVREVCSRLNFLVYSGDTKVQSIVQKKGDADFGMVELSLPEGVYKVAVVAHSSEASATVTSLDKISFKNNLVTDTFWSYLELSVGEDVQNVNMELKRVVAMFRMSLTEDLPEQVAQLKFYYTGGSSTLSGLTGYGSVNSKQTVVLNVEKGQRIFEVYTIPHAETGELKMTVTALDANGTMLKERLFEAVPVQRNYITRHTCDFFAGSSAETMGTSFYLQASAEWDGEQDYPL